MSSLPWIELDVDVFDHPKAHQLERLLGEPLAWAYAVRLWCYCARFVTTGLFSGPGAADLLEQAAGWRGEPGRLVEALVAATYVERRGDAADAFEVHGWAERSAPHLAKRERDRERAKARREAAASRIGESKSYVRRPDVAAPPPRRAGDVSGDSDRDRDQKQSSQEEQPKPFGIHLQVACPKLIEFLGAARAKGLDVSVPRTMAVCGQAESEIIRLGVPEAVALAVVAGEKRGGPGPVPLAYLLTVLRGGSKPGGKRGISAVGTDWSGKLEV